MEKALVGVSDESGLKKMMDSDEEESSDEDAGWYSNSLILNQELFLQPRN